MDIVLDRGNIEAPKGHALLYFRSATNSQEIWATYVVILPISVDVSKYVPPFLMNQVGEVGPKDLSAFAFPPAPELVEDYAVLESIAEQREDDIIFAGTMNPNDVGAAMMSINEVVQQYAEMCVLHTDSIGGQLGDESEASVGVGVNEVMYELMSNGDKLEELTKMVSRLRFAVDGSDGEQVREAEEDINTLARHFPENHNINRIVDAVKADDDSNKELADLYLQRCYFLVNEEYHRLGEVEKRLNQLERGQIL